MRRSPEFAIFIVAPSIISDMASLKTRVGTLDLERPGMVASGIMDETGPSLVRMMECGCGAVVTKSIGLQPNQGHANPSFTEVDGGYVNAMGLPNPGIEEFSQEMEVAVRAGPVIGSIYGSGTGEFSELAGKMEDYGASAVELNLSCPHAKGFGMEVLAYDIHPDEHYAREAGIAYVGLDELYRRADVISLHRPLTEQTRYMINSDTIALMKPGVVLLNTGRGQLIHTEALIEGLKQRRIGAAGLDVYEEEAGYFYEDTSDRIMGDDVLARLLSFNNVLVTSHQGFFTREALENIARTTLDNIRAFAAGGPLVNEVRFGA